MNPVISYIANLHPLSFMGYYVLSTTVIYILLNMIIVKTRPAKNTTAVPAPYSISPLFSLATSSRHPRHSAGHVPAVKKKLCHPHPFC